MNIIEAIRKGKEDLPNAEEIAEEIVSVKDDKIIGICAFGAMAVGRFGEKDTIKLHREGKLLGKLTTEFPILFKDLKSPITKLYKYIWYLNDKKGLTINQVADRLDRRGLR